MKAEHHLPISITVSLICYLLFKSISASVACLLSGILIDFDHLIDYFNTHGVANFSLNKFFEKCHLRAVNTCYLILHAYEIVLLFTVLAYITNYNMILVGITIGLAHHIILDQFCNNVHPFTYFILFRVVKRFRAEEFIKGHIKTYPTKTRNQLTNPSV